MGSISVKIENERDLMLKFDKMNIAPMDFFKPILESIGNDMVRAMRAEAPVSKYGVKSKAYESRTHAPGTLRRSIGKKVGGDSIPTVWVSPRRYERRSADAWYSHIVLGGHTYKTELGTSRTKPNPFVREAYDKSKSSIETKAVRMVEARIKKLMAI